MCLLARNSLSSLKWKILGPGEQQGCRWRVVTLILKLYAGRQREALHPGGRPCPLPSCGLPVVETAFLSSSERGVDGFSGAIRRMGDGDDAGGFLWMRKAGE